MIELNMAKFNVKNPQTGEFEPLDGASQAKVQSDWNQTDNSAEDFIKNKPTIPAAQVNSDWIASSGAAEILNKPSLGTAAAKDYTTNLSDLSDDLITSSVVNVALANKADKSNTLTGWEGTRTEYEALQTDDYEFYLVIEGGN